jgi:hypothetical protein
MEENDILEVSINESGCSGMMYSARSSTISYSCTYLSITLKLLKMPPSLSSFSISRVLSISNRYVLNTIYWSRDMLTERQGCLELIVPSNRNWTLFHVHRQNRGIGYKRAGHAPPNSMWFID